MKKMIVTLLLSLFFSFHTVQIVAAQTNEITEEESAYLEELGPLKVAVFDGTAPLMYQDEKGNAKGLSILVMDELVKILKIEVEYINYESAKEMLEGDYHFILSTTLNYVDPNEMVLSTPYLKSELVVIYNKKWKPNELKGEKHGILSGGKIPEGVAKEEVIEFDSREETLAAIEKGEVAYAYGNIYSLAYYDFKNSYENIAYVPTGEPAREYSFGVKNEYAALVPILNKALATLGEDRINTLTLQAISDVEKKIDLRVIIEEHYVLFIFLVIVIFSYIIATNKKLKKQIQIIEKSEAKIKQLSYYDTLTGLYNRRYAEEELKKVEESHQAPVSIIVGDVNGLKLINDYMGHQLGDELLVEVAKILKKSCQVGDIVARYGGDEFLVILCGVTSEETQEIITAIKENCEKNATKTFPVSISLGHATRTEGETTICELLKEADQVMYHNKKQESAEFKQNLQAILDGD